MAFDNAQLDATVRDTWTAVCGLPIEPLDDPIAHAERQRFLSAMIQISGDWVGAVVMDVEPGLARNISATLLGIESNVVVKHHMSDALGELVNIVGGSLKADLPPDTALSLPTLMVGVDIRMFLPGARPVLRTSYSCNGERLQVTVFQMGDPGEATPNGSAAETIPGSNGVPGSPLS